MIDAIALRSRLVMMLASLERAGVSPISVEQLHAFAYFANVMSPLWNLTPLQGSVLKRRGGPFYVELQSALDNLISIGAVDVVSLNYVEVEGGSKLSATVRLSFERTKKILALLERMPDELETGRFLEELAFVFAEIEPDKQDDAVSVDATYGSPSSPEDRVVDFAEWRETARNYSVPAAQRLQAYAPKGVTLSQAEELVLYMRLMKKRVGALGK